MTTPPAAHATPNRFPSLEAGASRTADRLVGAITRRAGPGTRGRAVVERSVRLPLRAVIAWAIFSWFLVDATISQQARGGPGVWLALLAVPAGLLSLRRPLVLGMVMVAGATWLRLVTMGVPETCDQMAVSRAALGIITAGGNPWGFGYPESVPPGAPYPYGPLAAITSLGGVPAEVLAMAGILVILAWQRALLTIALLGPWVAWIELGVCGINDQIPSLLLLGGLLVLEGRRRSGAVLVALSAGIKPYALAWVPPLLGFGGLAISLVLLGCLVLAWSPGLLWGPRSFLDSVELARSIHPRPENTLNVPQLRILAAPLAIAALWVRSWTTAVLTGALIFVTVLFLDHWASFGYWLVVLPPVGIIAERALARLGTRLRGAMSAPVTQR